MATVSILKPQEAQQKAREVTRILWRVLVLNIIVAGSKISVGVLTGTIAIVADGLHSLVDSASNVIGLIAQRIASQPPDDEHPYGHERFETLATLAIGGLLMLTAWEVLTAAIDNLSSGHVPDIGVLQFGVLGGTLVINVIVASYERHQANQLNSELLTADAQHTASDIWVTLSVIASLIAVELGLAWMDAVAALGIVGLIAYIAWGIVRRTSTVLVDAAPIPSEAITQVVSDTPGIQRVLRARSRGARDAIHIDLDVQVAPVISTELAYNITAALRQRVAHSFPNTNEGRIQIVTSHEDQPDYLTAARAAADALGLSVHEIIGVSTPEGRILELHVEVKAGITLREAHDQINQIETRLLQHAEIIEVVTHIEPAAVGSVLPAKSPEAQVLQDRILEHLHQEFDQGNWHHASIRRDGFGYLFTCHCHLPGDISIEMAHRIAEEAELSLRSAFPQLHRVTIHTEPYPENQSAAPGKA
ncbi:MAG: cation-efflux pump [Chloroflexi bacterium]|nr:cation-efflux pump [Chloroflexota bacterium]